jgi:GH18 family chitinase
LKDFAARFWNELGMPKEKIIIGMATYGRGWTLKANQPDMANTGMSWF